MDKNLLMLAALTVNILNVTPIQASEKGEKTPHALTEKADTVGVNLQAAQVVSTRAGKHTPMAYNNLSRKDIESVNYGKDIPFLLMFTPSVTTTSDAGAGIGYSSIRVRGTDPSRINITTNGIPVNDAESSQVFWTNMGDFASSVENMQIQRGVGTSTNGAGAFGATINMQTEKIGTKPYAGVDLSAGSYASHKETFRFGTGLIKNHWAFQGRLSHIASDGYVDRASTRLDSYFLQGGYFGENTVVKFITFNGKEKTYHAWNYPSVYEMELAGSRRYNSCGEYYDEAGNVHYYKDQSDFYHQQHYQLLLNQIITPTLKFNAALHYTKGFGYYEEYKSGRKLGEYGLVGAESAYFKTKTDLVRQKLMDNDFYGAVASFDYDNRQNLRATVGGGWNRYDGDHYGLVKWVKNTEHIADLQPNHRYYSNNGDKRDANIYGKVSYEFVKGLSAYVDLQYRHINYKMDGPTDDFSGTTQQVFDLEQKYDFFNPKAGLFYQINRNHSVYASYALAHKEPTRNDFEDNINAHLRAEQLNDWELGYKYQSEKFSAGVNFYYMAYRDQFVLTGEQNEIGEFIARNAGESYRRGVELQAAWSPVKWFRWDANATWSHNRAKDWTVTLDDGTAYNLGDTPLSFSPDFIFNNIFTFDYRGFRAALTSQYVGKQRLSNTGFDYYVSEEEDGNHNVSMVLKRHFITNLDLAYTFRMKGVKRITAGCTFYNLFSAKYFNNGWTAPSYKKDGNGKVVAYTSSDRYETGYAVSAPFNVMGHLSFEF